MTCDTIVARPRLRDMAALASAHLGLKARGSCQKPWWPALATLRRLSSLKTPDDGSVLDQSCAMVPGDSFTGEDILELQGHGGQ